MKTAILITSLSLNNIYIYPQSVQLGIGDNFLTGNKYYYQQFRSPVKAEFSFENSANIFSISMPLGCMSREKYHMQLIGIVKCGK